MFGMIFADIGTLRKRDDGEMRTDSAQAAYEEWQAECKLRLARAQATCELCQSDPILKSLDKNLDRGGIEAWNERYLIIADILDLIKRESGK